MNIMKMQRGMARSAQEINTINDGLLQPLHEKEEMKYAKERSQRVDKAVASGDLNKLWEPIKPMPVVVRKGGKHT